jgi:hypothetical protein
VAARCPGDGLDVPATGNLPGPNAVAFIERALAALAPTGQTGAAQTGATLTGAAQLETIGLLSGAVRLVAQTELDQQRAGQDAAAWQGALAGYLLGIVAGGQHPYLAAALTAPPAAGDPAQPDSLFDRALTRILAGLLPPAPGPGP